MFTWGSQLNKQKHDNQKHHEEKPPNKREVITKSVLKQFVNPDLTRELSKVNEKYGFINEVSINNNRSNTADNKNRENTEQEFKQLYEQFIHLEKNADPIYDDFKEEQFIHVEKDADPMHDEFKEVVKKYTDICDFYYDFNNAPTIESILNRNKINKTEAMGYSNVLVEQANETNKTSETSKTNETSQTSEINKTNETSNTRTQDIKVLYNGFAGKFCSYKSSKTKLLVCIPVKIFEVMKSGDFFKINYANCNECEFIYKTKKCVVGARDPMMKSVHSVHSGHSGYSTHSNFIELSKNGCVLSLCDPCPNPDLPGELSSKYICYELVCESDIKSNIQHDTKSDQTATNFLFSCLNSLYEHCRNVYYGKMSNCALNKYRSVISGKYFDYHELLWNEPISRVLDVWTDVNYVIYINRDVFNAVYVAPEHKLSSGTLGTLKCNPGLTASNVSSDGGEINAQDYLVKFSNKDNNFGESSENRVVYLMSWVSDMIKHRSHEHAKKYSKWMQLEPTEK